MKALIFAVSMLTFAFSGILQAQSLSDITDNLDQFTYTIPGITCKTRTNNEATVRNLAKGVFNKNSSSPVAVNCGWPVSAAWVLDTFANDARIDGIISPVWIRTAGTPLMQANEAFCAIFAAGRTTTASPPNVAGTMIATVSPNFNGNVGEDEVRGGGMSTNGLDYPDFFNAPGVDDAMFTAFCRIPQGVRLQAVTMVANSVGSHP